MPLAGKIQVCTADIRRFQLSVPSNSQKGKTYEVTGKLGDTGEIECGCPSFRWRRECSHVKLTVDECGWSGADGELQTPFERSNSVCPRCGSKTMTQMYGGLDEMPEVRESQMAGRKHKEP